MRERAPSLVRNADLTSLDPTSGRNGARVAAAGQAQPADRFDDWLPREYLADYYARLDEDESHTLAFLAQELHRRGRVAPRTLDFGVGPTVHHLLALAPWAESIDAADYLDGNLREVRRWLRDEAGAHDGSPFAAQVLACEGAPRVDVAAARAREALVRRRVARLLRCDASRDPAIAGARPGSAGYDLVMSCYCAESATADRSVWRRYMRHILALLRPGGLLLMAALRRCRGYTIRGQVFPAAGIDEGDIAGLLDDFAFDDPRRRILQARHLAAGPLHGDEGVVLLACERREATGDATGDAAMEAGRAVLRGAPDLSARPPRRRLPPRGESDDPDVRPCGSRSFPRAGGAPIAPPHEDLHAP